MEPRARAGKNVGKMNFGYGELRQLLYGGGDARDPLPETMRVLDEIATDFIQSLSFEAARIGQYSGRQKIKYEDFEFALRRNPLFLGKVREMFEMSKEVKDARKMPGIGEGNMGKADINDLAKLGEGDEGGEGTNKNGEGPSAGGAAASATPTSGTGRGKKRGPYAKTAGKRKKAKMEQEAAEAAAAEAAAAAAATAKDGDGGVVNVKEEPADDTTQGARGVTADTADGAADEEPDAEEPSNLDALFGGGDDADADGDDDLGF
ncbi:hypothetical protein HMPREF1624_03533 [Sporothrix schenckii ATCC 58251]|uniref:Transcription initiation factor TFIID subunit 13 n=1 Tax=Sporothrix schenckii (strain ATCC 58251 / de Perez 2211183) TaxID=1391915 RepID=U7PWX9_SPOS1|nr:hypothetical protein HMPREF1624_03533 [Sporothrix schenckii ATCC 58251]